MVIIQQDKHSLYVVCNGWLFRPLFPVGYEIAFPSKSQFIEGDQVKGRHHSGTPLATVAKDDVKETWYSHGMFFDHDDPKKTIPSEQLYDSRCR